MAVDDLLNTLRNGSSDDPDAQWRAAIALGTTEGEDRAQAIAALLEILSGGVAHALTRSHAVEALGRLSDPQAIPVLIIALNDPYRLVRAYAANALGRVAATEDVVTRLLERFENDDYFGVRAESATAVVAVARRMAVSQVLDRVRAALVARRLVESTSTIARAERVTAEIDRALTILDRL